MIMMLSLKAIYRQKRSHQLGRMLSCAFTDRSRICIAPSSSACARRFLLKAFSDRLGFDGKAAVGLMMLMYSF